MIPVGPFQDVHPLPSVLLKRVAARLRLQLLGWADGWGWPDQGGSSQVQLFISTCAYMLARLLWSDWIRSRSVKQQLHNHIDLKLFKHSVSWSSHPFPPASHTAGSWQSWRRALVSETNVSSSTLSIFMTLLIDCTTPFGEWQISATSCFTIL